MGSAKTTHKIGGVLVRQEEIDLLVRSHRYLYREMQRIHEKPTRQSIKDKLNTFKSAEQLLRDLEHFLCRDKEKYPPIPIGMFCELTHEHHRRFCFNSAFKVLEEAQEFLKKIPVGTGRPIAETIAGPGACASRLAELFKAKTGKCHWKMIGEALAKGFPETLKGDDGSRDLRLWAYRLAQRHERALYKMEPGSTIPKLFGPLVWGLVENRDRI